MKKAKIMLSAIAVFAVVGTGIAFKANKGRIIYTGFSIANCSTAVTGEIVPAGTPLALKRYASTQGAGSACSYTYTLAFE